MAFKVSITDTDVTVAGVSINKRALDGVRINYNKEYVSELFILGGTEGDVQDQGGLLDVQCDQAGQCHRGAVP